MMKCDYCGAESDDTAEYCIGCGQALVARSLAPTRLTTMNTRKRLRALNAGSATFILVASLASELLCGGLLGAVAGIVSVAQGTHSQRQILVHLTPIMVVLAPAVLGVVTIVSSLALVPQYLKDTTASGGAWVAGSMRGILIGLVIGFLIGASTLALHFGTQSVMADRRLPPLARLAMAPGLPREAWAVAMVLLAPPAEELLFRGVLYGGYCRSFGRRWAAISTTLIFVALHLPFLGNFLSGTAGLIGLALAALWCRLHSRAIGPAVAVHVGYNLVWAFRVLA